MGSKREKYPEKCPWDLGPNQHLAKEENWTLRLGEANVCFSKNKLDNNSIKKRPNMIHSHTSKFLLILGSLN